MTADELDLIRWESDGGPERAAVVAAYQANGYQTRQCRNCGDELSDVEWLFDPCPASESGTHREARL